MAYTTVSNIEDKLGKSLTTEQTNYFNNVLSDAVDNFIEEETKTEFGKTTSESKYVSGDGTDILVVPTLHTLTTVHKLGSDRTETLVDATDYFEFPDGDTTQAIVKTTGTWTEGFHNYKITGKFGYASVPGEITLVATELAVNEITENPNNYESEKVGDWQVKFSNVKQSLSKQSSEVLARYQRLSRSI